MEPVVPKHIDDLIGFDPKSGQAECPVDKSKQNQEESIPAKAEEKRQSDRKKEEASGQSHDCLSIC